MTVFARPFQTVYRFIEAGEKHQKVLSMLVAVPEIGDLPVEGSPSRLLNNSVALADEA